MILENSVYRRIYISHVFFYIPFLVLIITAFNFQTFQEQCLLGQRVQIRRRLRDSKCFNGEDFVREIVNKTCKCENEDFEW